MTTLSGPVQADGALVDTEIGWSAADAQAQRALLRPVPPAMAVRALLDSGAQVTCLDTALVRTLGLPAGGITLATVPAVGGLTFGMRYGTSVVVLHPSGAARAHLVLRNLLVVELPLGQLGYQALIGRDVLARCRFLYDGPGGRFRLRY